MTRCITALLAAFIAFSTTPGAALARGHMMCSHHHEMRNMLARKYSESVRGVGIVGNYMFQLWVNEMNGTWSITRTRTNKITCLLAAGDGWEFFPAQPPGDPA